MAKITNNVNGKTTFLTSKNTSVKHVDRIILNKEFKELLNGKCIVMAYIRHRFKNYELKGYLREVKIKEI